MASVDPKVENILIKVAKSKYTVKSQQRNEPELTESEKMTILRDMFSKRPASFLARFGKCLGKEDLASFDHLRNNYEVNFRLKDLETLFDRKKNEINVRNRRYDCLQRLISDSDYFSEESMRKRCPLLYEQYIGQYLSEEEKLQRDRTAMGEEPSLSEFLLSRQERDMTEWLYEYQKEQEEGMEEEEDTESESEPEEDRKREGEGKNILVKFRFAMYMCPLHQSLPNKPPNRSQKGHQSPFWFYRNFHMNADFIPGQYKMKTVDCRLGIKTYGYQKITWL